MSSIKNDLSNRGLSKSQEKFENLRLT